MAPTGNRFDHEKLSAYQASIRFLALAERVVESLPPSRTYLANQLLRAATSIALNIAEGAGEFSGPEKARFYRMALRSASECAALLDATAFTGAVATASRDTGRGLLLEITAMLTALVKAQLKRR